MNAVALAVSLLLAPVSVQLPLSLTPPTPPTFTQAVSQTLVINGQSYAVSGTLTFTPTGGTVALPPLPGGKTVEFPQGSGYLWVAKNGLYWTSAALPDWAYTTDGGWSSLWKTEPVPAYPGGGSLADPVHPFRMTFPAGTPVP